MNELLAAIATYLKAFYDHHFKIQRGDTQPVYLQNSVTIPAYGRHKVYSVYRYFRILSTDISSPSLKVKFGENGLESDISSAGIGIDAGGLYDRLEIYNNSASSVTLTFAIGLERIDDNRLSVNGQVAIKQKAAASISTSQVTVSTTATQLHGGSSSAKQSLLRCDTSDFYVGNTNGVTTANGFLVKAGESISIATEGNLWGVVASGTPTVYVMREDY